MSDPDSARIDNQAPNQGAQGVFYGPVYILPRSASATEDRSYRTMMLERVRSNWIDGVLKQSSPSADVRLVLNLFQRSDLKESPWRGTNPATDPPPGPLLPGTRITHVYKATGKQLLILGKPGSGKTTLLLELASDLLEDAEKNDTNPMPVVFLLSSWAINRQPLKEWLIEELHTKYTVPPNFARTWVEANQVLPLLDGLDEVAKAYYSACIEAINAYLGEHGGLTPLVVCSRSDEYVDQTRRLLVQRVVIVKPLTEQQIDDYFDRLQDHLDQKENDSVEQGLSPPPYNLKQAYYDWVRDYSMGFPGFQELVGTPLIVNVFLVLINEQPIKGITKVVPIKTQKNWGNHMWSIYVQRLLTGPDAQDYMLEQAIHWLSWLAWQLKQHNLTEFYIEQIQMHWLRQGINYRRYLGLGFGGIVGFFVWLIYVATYSLQPFLSGWEKVFGALLPGLFTTFIFFILYGVIIACLEKFRMQSNIKYTRSIYREINQKILEFLQNRIFYGLSIGFPHGLFISLFIGVPYGVLHGLFFSIGYAIVGRADGDVQPAEVIVWSWGNTRRKFIRFLLWGLFTGLLFGLASGPIYTFVRYHVLRLDQIIYIFLVGTVVGLGVGSVFMLINSISYAILDKNKHIVPNEGIRRSACNSIVFGLISGLYVSIIAALAFGPFLNWIIILLYKRIDNAYSSVGLGWGIGIGIAVGVVVALRNGGLACLQHSLLRFLLWRDGLIPWNYPRFLDYAAKHKLLYKVGGGYIFMHRFLFDYFASIETFSPSGQELSEPL